MAEYESALSERFELLAGTGTSLSTSLVEILTAALSGFRKESVRRGR